MLISHAILILAAYALLPVGWVCVMLVSAVVFPRRSDAAYRAVLSSPGRCGAWGTGLTLLAVLITILLARAPGPVRLSSSLAIAALFLLAILGTGGLATLVGERIRTQGAAMEPFPAMTRGAILLTLGGYMPVVGWFLVGPVTFIVAVGAGWLALRRPPQAAEAPTGGVLAPMDGRRSDLLAGVGT